MAAAPAGGGPQATYPPGTGSLRRQSRARGSDAWDRANQLVPVPKTGGEEIGGFGCVVRSPGVFRSSASSQSAFQIEIGFILRHRFKETLIRKSCILSGAEPSSLAKHMDFNKRREGIQHLALDRQA